MMILYGESGSGKTTWFLNRYKKHRIVQSENLQNLRTTILSINSPLLDENLPTLINTWFDLNVKDILDLKDIDVTIETHYYETEKGKRVVGSGKDTHYWGLRNEMMLRKINPKSIMYFPPKKKNKTKIDMIEVFGPLYSMIRSQFPELLE